MSWPSAAVRDRVAELGRWRARDDEESVIVVGQCGLQDDLVGRGIGDRVDDRALGLERRARR